MNPMSNAHVLPDSRLRDKVGAVMGDWELCDGTTVRIEMEPIFCANCGKLSAHVPKENTGFAFYLCRKCEPVFGVQAGFMGVPDDEFNRAVAAEMEARFGHALDDDGIRHHLENHTLGRALELLAKESPHPTRLAPGER